VGGRVGTVGIGGHALGGGSSPFANRHGWLLDNVYEYEVGLKSFQPILLTLTIRIRSDQLMYHAFCSSFFLMARPPQFPKTTTLTFTGHFVVVVITLESLRPSSLESFHKAQFISLHPRIPLIKRSKCSIECMTCGRTQFCPTTWTKPTTCTMVTIQQLESSGLVARSGT
jgi:hypothetical protein